MITSWLNKNSMYYLAQTGQSAGLSVYHDLDPSMTLPPRNLIVAYEQAIYFLSLAARRADGTGADQAAATLLRHVDAVAAEAKAVGQNVSLACQTTGIGCPKLGSTRVLHGAAGMIASSGLNADDVSRINGILLSNARALTMKRAIPVVGLVAIGAVLGTWWWRRQA